jgi:hypothetical protein
MGADGRLEEALADAKLSLSDDEREELRRVAKILRSVPHP